MKKFLTHMKGDSVSRTSKRRGHGTSVSSVTEASASSASSRRKSLHGMEIHAVSCNHSAASSLASRDEEHKRPVKMSDPSLPLILEYMRCLNAHDLKAMALVCEKDVTFDFVGSVFHWASWEAEMENLFKAFPDFHFEWDNIVYESEDGVLAMQEFQASGTHTGCSYGFGPYPKIQPTGIKVKNDPEVLHFYFKNGKISKIVFITKGRLTGPSGIYTQLGGFLIVPVEEPKRVKMSDPNLPLVLEYMRCMNAHDLEGMAAVCSETIKFDFVDAAFDRENWETEMENLFQSFPDFCFDWDDIVYGSEKEVLVMLQFEASGTHTGRPYGFGPYPEIEATGTKVKNDPEVLHFHFDDKKISKILFVTKGRLTGPPGVYTQLGGFALQ